MKRTALLLLALLNAAALLSASSPKSDKDLRSTATGFPATSVSVTRWDSLHYTMKTEKITPGVTQKKVSALLGKPAKILGPNVLLYDNCAPDQDQAQHCRNLIITFSEGKVASMVFSNPLMTDLIAFQAQYKNPETPPSALALPTQ